MFHTKVLLLFITSCCLLLEINSSLTQKDEDINLQQKGTLVFVHMFYRHGDRAPIQQSPGDKYDISYWPNGWGQLTNLGKQQLFELGQWFRRRYNGFLSASYNPNDIYVQSSDVDRTLMSAQANLAGLYPPQHNQIWNPNLMWQPIPIHTKDLKTDYLITGGTPSCPAYQKAYMKYLQSDEMKKIEERAQPIYNILSANVGETINSLINVTLLHDSWLCESIHNLTLSNWTIPLFRNNEEFEKAAMAFYYIRSATKHLAKFASGFLLKDILDRFTSKIESTLKPDRKVYMYSTHDLTLFNFLQSLGVSDNKFVPYAACIILELRRYKNDYYVQMFYKKSNKTPDPIEIPGCGTACPLSKMYEIYDDILPKNNFNIECQIDE